MNGYMNVYFDYHCERNKIVNRDVFGNIAGFSIKPIKLVKYQFSLN